MKNLFKRSVAVLLTMAFLAMTFPSVIISASADETSNNLEASLSTISDTESENYIMSDGVSYSLPLGFNNSSKTYYHPDSNVSAITVKLLLDIRADFNGTSTTSDDCYDILYVR